ncbi:MAG: hypothetical protein OEQ39_00060 [Gammaproteobacteria bacterium]|nr:hypothetical protein [Gammaproteobacteria bacterium]
MNNETTPQSDVYCPVLNKAELQDIINMMMQTSIQAVSIDAFLMLKSKLEAMIPHAPEPPPRS